jgi:hypothetical protein
VTLPASGPETGRISLPGAAEYLDVIVGDREGVLCAAFGYQPFRAETGRYEFVEWRQVKYAWPVDRDAFLADVAKELATGDAVDTFVAPLLRHKGAKGRRKGDALPPVTLFSDLDGAPADPARFAELLGMGASLVTSGTEGHSHLYLPLTRPIDLGTFNRLNPALAKHLGADSKFTDETLLRLPGTLNHKPTVPKDGEPAGPPTQVTSVGWNGKRADPDEVAALLGVPMSARTSTSSSTSSSSSGTGAGGESGLDPEPLPKVLSAAVLRALGDPDVEDRSKACARVISACAVAGLSAGQTLSVLNDFPPAKRYTSERHKVDDVYRFRQKVYVDRAERAEAEGRSTQSEEQGAGDVQDDGAVLVSLASVEPERLTWLWPGRLPAGKIVTIDGDPSVGKSTLAVDLAAHVSTGKPWPDGATCERGNVLILSAEDGLADTIRPRLDAAGGDPVRVDALTAVRAVDDEGKMYERPPTLADIAQIRAAILRTGAVLVVIDVLMAFLPGKVDSHKDQDIRAVLSRLTKVGEETGCTFVLLRHLNKGGSGSPMYRGGGSIGIVGAARAGFLVARDPDDPDTRVVACVKSNLAREPESLCYRLEAAPDSDVAHVVWTGTSAHDAAGLLRNVGDDDQDDRREIEEWLEEFMNDRDGRVAAKDVTNAGRKVGYSVDQVKRAKKKLGIESMKAGMGGGWDWAMRAEGSTKGAKGVALGEPHSSHPSVLPSETVRSDDGITDDPLAGVDPFAEGPFLADYEPPDRTCTRCGRGSAHDLVPPGLCRRCAYPADPDEWNGDA